MEPVRDDALDDDDEPRTATLNQTYSWLPGDAWDQYCADCLTGTPETAACRTCLARLLEPGKRVARPPPYIHSPGY